MFGLLIAIIYISFISLGLPDSMLGSAWPTIYPQFNVPVSYAGIISFVICFQTIVSSLLSDRLTRKFGAGIVTSVSVAMTALALLGFSLSPNFWVMLLCAIPYGLGAGGVDAALNNFVALHLSSKHMSWLHCMWGLGGSISPYIMGYALTLGNGWREGYFIVFVVQILLSIFLFCNLPVWKKGIENIEKKDEGGGQVCDETKTDRPLTLKEVVKIKGAVPCFITFFCYCALEQTTMLWASSYMVLHGKLSAETAANCASLVFIGCTLGRAVNGFLTMRFSDSTLIRVGIGVICVGIVALFLPFGTLLTLIGFALIGLGCAPIYPCIIHMTPSLFGRERSQAMIGVQMASAYIGALLVPPLFGGIANWITVSLLPVCLLIILILMFLMHELVVKKTSKKNE